MGAEIKDRKLLAVTIASVDMDYLPNGQPTVTAIFHLDLSGPDGDNNGPSVNVVLGIPVEPSASFQDISRAILNRAHEILERAALLSVEELEKSFVEWRKREIEKDQRAAAAGYEIKKSA